MISSADDAMEALRSWVAGKQPLKFTLSLSTVRRPALRADVGLVPTLNRDGSELTLQGEFVRVSFRLSDAAEKLAIRMYDSPEVVAVQVKFQDASLHLAPFDKIKIVQ
jgi:hypothetical protein